MNKQESWLPSSEGKKSEVFSFIYLPPEEQYQLLPPLFAETHVHPPPPSFWGVWGADGGDGEWWGGGEDAAQDWLVLSFFAPARRGGTELEEVARRRHGMPWWQMGWTQEGCELLFEDRPKGWKVVGRGPSIKTQS